jgi:hypothetical protein
MMNAEIKIALDIIKRAISLMPSILGTIFITLVLKVIKIIEPELFIKCANIGITIESVNTNNSPNNKPKRIAVKI